MILINLSVAEIEKKQKKKRKEGGKSRVHVKKSIDDCAMKNFMSLLFDCMNRY